MSEEIKRIDIAEFRRLGFLQEVNRLVLHPAGLALEVYVAEDGSATFGGCWDYRDDAEGIVYQGIDLAPAAASVAAEIERHRTAREAMFGDVIQPVVSGDTTGEPSDWDLAELATCATCGGRITRSSSEWFHVDTSDYDRMHCWRGGPLAAPTPAASLPDEPQRCEHGKTEPHRLPCDAICDAASGGSCFTPWCHCTAHAVDHQCPGPVAVDQPKPEPQCAVPFDEGKWSHEGPCRYEEEPSDAATD